nr:unnamed protein product [Digitaria exilis]
MAAAAEGRSLAETPTWSVATVTTLMVAACFLVERSLSRFAKWLRKTKRKAMLAALEKIREELMLLGVISLLLSQTSRFISEICVPSTLFTSRFYMCSEGDYMELLENAGANQTALDKTMFGGQSMHICSEVLVGRSGHEPFVSYEGLEQLHRFLFILGITHVLYSFVTVVLSMIKAKILFVSVGHFGRMRSCVYWSMFMVSTYISGYPFSLLFTSSLSWLWKSQRQQHLMLARNSNCVMISFGLESLESSGGSYSSSPFRQNAFELATFLWSLWELSSQTCFMKHYYMIVIRLISGLLVQFWCSYSTLPLNVIISQMGSKFKKSLVSENVRESLHSWCKRVKDRNRHNPLFSRNGTVTSRSVCSLDTTYETDHETNTVCTLSRTASATSLDDQLTVGTVEDDEPSCIEKDV